MIIRTVRVRNYMIHQDTSLTLRPLTVLVGPNGGGKSAFFDALLNFSMLSRGSIRQAFGPYPYSYRATLYRGAHHVSRIGYDIEMARSAGAPEYLRYVIDYAQTGVAEEEARFSISAERLTLYPEGRVLFDRGDLEAHTLGRDLALETDRGVFSALRRMNVAGEAVDVPALVTYCSRHISRFNKFRLDPAALAAPSRLPDFGSDTVRSAPFLGYHGEDLTRVLYFLSETEAPELDVIRRRIQEIEPAFSGFDFATVGTDRIAFAVQYSDQRGSVPSVRLSSGFLTFVGLIVLVSMEARPAVMMIEEPENGLTPRAVMALYSAIRESLEETTEDRSSQVLVSSHSPFVICEAWNGEDRDFIFQMEIREGRATVRPFSEAIGDHGTPLALDAGERKRLSINHADYVMSGYFR